MKIIKDYMSFYRPIEPDEIVSRLDTDAVQVEVVKCRCGNVIRMDEMYITRCYKELLDNAIRDFNDAAEEVSKAAVEIFGIDPAIIRFQKKMEDIRKNLINPRNRFSVIKGESYDR